MSYRALCWIPHGHAPLSLVDEDNAQDGQQADKQEDADTDDSIPTIASGNLKIAIYINS